MEKNINKGFIKLQREILEWEWYHDNNTFRLMIHLLLKSNYMLKKWQGNTINPGELVTSIGNLSKELKLSENVIRTSIKKLKKTDYIHTQSTNKFTKITIINSAIYEGLVNTNNNQKTNQNTNQSQSNDNEITTTKKVKKEIEIIECKEIFKTKVFQFQKKFSLEILNSFYNYWTEENEQTGRLKFENEDYFNIETRLTNWKQFSTSKSKKEPNNFYLNR